MLEKDIKKILFSQEDIVTKTKELGQQLTKDYAGKNPLLVCVLKGAVPFMAELIKHIDTHIEMDFMVVSSYGGGTVSSGEVKILKDVDTNIEGRDVIFIIHKLIRPLLILYKFLLLGHRHKGGYGIFHHSLVRNQR